LEELIRSSDPKDPVTATAVLLAENSASPKTPIRSTLKDTWYGKRANAAGKFLSSGLAEFLYNLVRPSTDARRLQKIQHLSRGLQTVTVLGQILGPISHATTHSVSSAAEIAPLLAWGGTPPGDSNDPLIQDCQRSYLRAVGQVRQDLTRSLVDEFGAVKLDSSIPKEYRRTEAILNVLQKGGLSRDVAEKSLKRMSAEQVSTSGSSVPDKKWCTELVNKAYGQTNLSFGLRIMGRKVGLIGPKRGSGKPRFMCDTPLLGTLVIGLLGEGTADFREFVDTCRNKLGLVFGIGTNEKLVKELGLWSQLSRGRNSLLRNQEALRKRLIRAGLAREYSDGHTEVMANV
jgi:hypothetical protein